jgi:hypothetical protein
VTTPRQQPTEAEAIAIANIALLGQQLATTTAGFNVNDRGGQKHHDDHDRYRQRDE